MLIEFEGSEKSLTFEPILNATEVPSKSQRAAAAKSRSDKKRHNAHRALINLLPVEKLKIRGGLADRLELVAKHYLYVHI